MKGLRLALTAAVLLAPVACLAGKTDATQAAQSQLASPGSGLDFGGLDKLFDAAKARPPADLAPPPAAPGRGRSAQMPQAPFPTKPGPWGRPSLVVPSPIATAAYRHTFDVLMAHPEVTDQYDELILKYSSAYHVDARLLKAIISAESEFFVGAVSPRGARGLMQLMPATAEEFGIPRGMLSLPEYNIAAGAAYIANLCAAARRRFKLKGVDFQDAPLWLQERIIAAYNAGPRFLTSSRFIPQTRAYVRKVLLFYHSKVTDLRRPSDKAKPKVPVALTPGTLY